MIICNHQTHTMFPSILSSVFAVTFASLLFITGKACIADTNMYNTMPSCPTANFINIEYYVNSTFWYFRPTEIGLTDPSVSAVPEYFALSGAALSMTQTLNELFQNFQTVHHGGPSLFNVPIPITLNNTDGTPCQSFVNVSIIPQYNLQIESIGASTSYFTRGPQGQANNRASCEVCNSLTKPFAVIHGELVNAGLYDVTSQVCNAFNVPVIAASVTDLTFQQLYPGSNAAAPWSALASTPPGQISNALRSFMSQFNWNFIGFFVDPNDQDNANEMSEIAFGFSFVPFENIDSTGTGCNLAILGFVESGLSIMYLDMSISKCRLCVRQLLTSGLLEQNYIIIWGPTLMTSVNNDLNVLAAAANVSISQFAGTFALQVRMKAASFTPILFENMNNLFASWNASFLSQYETSVITSIYDNANSVILASQGVAGLFADQLCFFGNQGVTTNLSESELNVSGLVSEITANLLAFLSNDQSAGNFNIIQSSFSLNSTWKIQISANELHIIPSQTFQYYTQSSGIWSEAVNIEQWYHDQSGNSLILFDVYNLVSGSVTDNNLVGTYFSSSNLWMPNPISIEWPNNAALWQYTSGFPSQLAPLSKLRLSCVTNYSCSSTLIVEESMYNETLFSYFTSVEFSPMDSGEWDLQIGCFEAGSVPSFGASLSHSSEFWNLFINIYSGALKLNFEPQLTQTDMTSLNEEIIVSFWCTNGFSVLNSSLTVSVNINVVPIDYDTTISARWGAGTANIVGIVVSVVGAFLTLIYRHRRPIYSASVSFLLISWVGFTLLFASGLISILQVTGNDICQIRPWLFNYGFTLVMGSLFLKTYHIHSIFNNDKLVIRQISMWHFILSLGIMLSLITAVMLVWQLSESLQLYRVSASHPYCETGSWIPFHFIAGLELLLVLSCLFVSYLTRRVKQDYNESKCIAIIVYNTTFWGIAWWVLSSQESISPPTLSLLTSVFICAVSFVNLLTFFFPKFYALSREDVKMLAITPRHGRSKLIDSALHLSAIEASAGLTMERSVNNTAFNVPEDPKEALKQFRERLFETIRKWKENDVEHRRLKGKIRDYETLRDTNTQAINNWMNAIRVTLTSTQLSSRDAEGLVTQMNSILRMNVEQLMEEAEKHEESSRKRGTVMAGIGSPKYSATGKLPGTVTSNNGGQNLSNQIELAVRI